MQTQSAASCPAEVLALLPWFPDGGLSDDERSLVESHAALCPPCRREIQALQGDATLPDGAPSPERVLARVFERIAGEADPPARGAAGGPVAAAPGGFVLPLRSRREAGSGELRARVAAQPRRHRQPARWWPGWAAAAALALVFGLSIGFGTARWLGDVPLYRTAASPAAVVAEEGPALDVVLREDVPAGRVREMLRAVGAQIVRGPSPFGRYEVRLPVGTDAAAVAAALSAQGTGIASFAQPMP